MSLGTLALGAGNNVIIKSKDLFKGQAKGRFKNII